MSLKDFYKGKKVVITGHTGFKGTWLSSWLLKMGASVYGYSKGIPTEPSMYHICGIDEHVERVFGDILDNESLSAFVQKVQPDIIFHIAGQAITTLAHKQPLKTFETNILGTASALEAFKNLETPCVMISITSDKSYLNKEWVWGYKETDEIGGKDPYSASKAGAEIVLQSYYQTYFKDNADKRLATARAGNIIGGGDWAINRIVPDCIRAWQSGQSVVLRSPDAIRPWQHVLDTIYGYLLLAKNLAESGKGSGEAFNFGPNPLKFETVSQLVHQLADSLNQYGIAAPVRIEKLENNFESGVLKLNSEKAFSWLGWTPQLELNEAVNYTGEWYYQCLWNRSQMLQITQQQIHNFEEKIKG